MREGSAPGRGAGKKVLKHLLYKEAPLKGGGGAHKRWWGHWVPGSASAVRMGEDLHLFALTRQEKDLKIEYDLRLLRICSY